VGSNGLNASGGSCSILASVDGASLETNQLGGFLFVDS
jgi:hypothetical protein